MNDHPIGFFDSGVGGTSIWKEVRRLLPHEHSIYLADSRNAPYGEKSLEEIVSLSVKNTELLLEKGCKLIVVACNTATTNAIATLRSNYDIPFIGIEPAIKPAALQSETKTVGILATKGTLSSSLFNSTSENHAQAINIVEQVGTGLVPLVEQGKIDAPETRALLKSYLTPMLDAGIDRLVLGCTHYPYLIPVLQKLLPENVRIIDSGEAVARQTKAVLEEKGLINGSEEAGRHRVYGNSELRILETLIDHTNGAVQISSLEF